MQELIEVIRAAVTSGASTEQKAAGAHACRTILAVLDTEPGKPIVPPGVPAPSPMASLSIDQVLDLLIARLSTIANARDAKPQPPAPAPQGLRVPPATPSRPTKRATTTVRASTTRKP